MGGRGSWSLYLILSVGVALLPGCSGGRSSPSGPDSGSKSGTIAGTVSGTTSRGAASGTVTGAISTSGAMSGTIAGAIRSAAAAAGIRTADTTPDVTFTGSANGTHNGSGVTGIFTGTASNGATFSGTFSGDMVAATLTYRATGSITFSGAVTGSVDVVLNGDCPGGNGGTDQPTPTPAPTPTPIPTPTPSPAPPLPSAALVGSWSGTYSLNGTPGSMTWSITSGGADGNSGTYTGSLAAMPSGAVSLGVINPDNSIHITLHLTCPGDRGLVVFQGDGQLAGSAISGSVFSIGGGNCGDAALNTWTVVLAMTKS